jgi:tetraacyldisaccharide 4'-kinase
MRKPSQIIDRLRCRIESAARAKRPAPFFSLETVLLIISVLYGGVLAIRACFYAKGIIPSKALPCRVISIGNIVAGGTGKTPLTIFLARMIKEQGYRVVVLSRGYRGRMEKAGGIVSDGQTIFKGPHDAGDEPYLMARTLRGVPIVVGKRRYEAGMMAVQRFRPDVIVLDDAFQHLRLKRDLNLVLLDSRSPFGNGNLLPRGLLREPLSALHRADAFVFTRCDKAARPSLDDRLLHGRPLFYTDHTAVVKNSDPQNGNWLVDTEDIAILKGASVVAFAGLADNEQFFDALKQAGAILVSHFSFADHHQYDCSDLGRISSIAAEKSADFLVTTVKDYVKIEQLTRLSFPIVAVDVRITLSRNEYRNDHMNKPQNPFTSFVLNGKLGKMKKHG